LINLSHAARSQVRRYFVVCDFGSDHCVNEIWRRILPNNPQVNSHV
jgi:hypothetical protein